MTVLADNTKQNVLIRDHYECQLRLPGCDRYATVVVPKPGVRRGIRALRSTELQAACKDCATTPAAELAVEAETVEKPKRKHSKTA